MSSYVSVRTGYVSVRTGRHGIETVAAERMTPAQTVQ
jgi:hypothetical protein